MSQLSSSTHTFRPHRESLCTVSHIDSDQMAQNILCTPRKNFSTGEKCCTQCGSTVPDSLLCFGYSNNLSFELLCGPVRWCAEVICLQIAGRGLFFIRHLKCDGMQRSTGMSLLLIMMLTPTPVMHLYLCTHGRFQVNTWFMRTVVYINMLITLLFCLHLKTWQTESSPQSLHAM